MVDAKFFNRRSCAMQNEMPHWFKLKNFLPLARNETSLSREVTLANLQHHCNKS
jgi:hypothetical protein